VARAHRQLDWVADTLAELYAVLQEQHPEYCDIIEAMGREALILQSQFEDLWVALWGELPSSWESWAE